jgi:hypothetical protein
VLHPELHESGLAAEHDLVDSLRGSTAKREALSKLGFRESAADRTT